eukprot:171110-Prorocentrum_lima.AAC.1
MPFRHGCALSVHLCIARVEAVGTRRLHPVLAPYHRLQAARHAASLFRQVCELQQLGTAEVDPLQTGASWQAT